ncbi:recombinase family protein [Photobacterium phosphoreum]|uniref:recombinase family protein n=1 Tax=Photobacterium phosphoreum TaxID=659 RepID=UPI001EFEA56F|nr:recombinase family protein [Photobacterium phosphoreum]
MCSGTVPATKREQLSRLLDKLRKGDVLVVWWIDRLGRDYHDSEKTIRDLLNRGVTIKTINQDMTFAYTGNDMQDMTTNIQLTMITAMAAAERKNRLAYAKAGRQAIKQDPKLWAEKFSGRQRNNERTLKVIELLEQGLVCT